MNRSRPAPALLLAAAALLSPPPAPALDFDAPARDAPSFRFQLTSAPPAPAARCFLPPREQFAGPPRDQKGIGACQIFAAIGLLEAAYFRGTCERRRFSEADLFLRRRLVWESFDLGHTRRGVVSGVEADTLDDPLNQALSQGVASSPDYEDFARRWALYRTAQRKSESTARVGSTIAGAVLENSAGVPAAWVGWLGTPLYVSLLNTSPVVRDFVRYVEGVDRSLRAERERHRLAFAHMRRRTVNYPDPSPSALASDKECGEKGADRAKALAAEIDARRPAGVVMNIKGLSEWKGDPNGNGRHVFLVVDYSRDKDGALVFKTRNSWGEKPEQSPDLTPNRLCRVSALSTVLNTPMEKASF